MGLSRRSFIKRAAAGGLAAAGILSSTAQVLAGQGNGKEYGTLIDLSRCDGCPDKDTPRCVMACRSKNSDRFPEPEKPIMDYWPQTKHEDWSDKKGLTNRLTPYNWTYVQHLEVEHNGQKVQVHVPRRCMHCDNPPCSGLCPFGVNKKMPEGPVLIDENGCFGGAKCRDVCPWHIPQRQAGVGLYKDVAPKYAGGGVMYKCDLCYDRIQQGLEPACAAACPNGAISFGLKQDLLNRAREWAEKNKGYIYGDTENGGTSTFYISPVPFSAIDAAVKEQEMDGKPGRPGMQADAANPLDEPGSMAEGFLLAPVAGIMAAGLSVYRIMKGDENDENTEA